MSKHLALTLLRRTIDVFRQKTRDSYLDGLEVLSLFFEHINSNEDVDEHEIEGTLKRWSKSSKDIAEIAEVELRNGSNGR